MQYNDEQLKVIQKKLKEVALQLKESKDGFGSILIYSDFTAWASHAMLAGYSIEKVSGLMYRQEGNVRTYFETS